MGPGRTGAAVGRLPVLAARAADALMNIAPRMHRLAGRGECPAHLGTTLCCHKGVSDIVDNVAAPKEGDWAPLSFEGLACPDSNDDTAPVGYREADMTGERSPSARGAADARSGETHAGSRWMVRVASTTGGAPQLRTLDGVKFRLPLRFA